MDAQVGSGRPAAVAAFVRRCESAYHADKWFVTVPAELYLTLAHEEPVK